MKRLITVCAAAVISLFAADAQAVPIFVSQTQVLDIDGEDMNFAFGALPAPDGTGGTVTIQPTASGVTLGLDLSGGFPGEDENFEVQFDGVSQGFFSCGGPSNNGSTAIPGAVDNSANFNDCVFTLSIPVNAPTLMALLADGGITIGVLFGDQVSTFSHNDEVTVSLAFNSAAAPEPATLALLGLGLAGVAARRRRQ